MGLDVTRSNTSLLAVPINVPRLNDKKSAENCIEIISHFLYSVSSLDNEIRRIHLALVFSEFNGPFTSQKQLFQYFHKSLGSILPRIGLTDSSSFHHFS